MLISEFIERTGFEPTADEYAEIENEYIGCDIDKDKFCKQWLKNGGIQRLCRLRARMIETMANELESKQRRIDEACETMEKYRVASQAKINQLEEKVYQLENEKFSLGLKAKAAEEVIGNFKSALQGITEW